MFVEERTARVRMVLDREHTTTLIDLVRNAKRSFVDEHAMRRFAVLTETLAVVAHNRDHGRRVSDMTEMLDKRSDHLNFRMDRFSCHRPWRE